MALNGFGIPDRIPVERTAPMRRRRFGRTRTVVRSLVTRAAPAARVTVVRVGAAGRSAGRRLGRFGRAFAGSRAGQESGKGLLAAVKTVASMGAGALTGVSEGLVTTEGEKKALPWVRRGIALGLNYAGEKWGGKAGKLLDAIGSGVGGADGALSVQRRAGVVSAKK